MDGLVGAGPLRPCLLVVSPARLGVCRARQCPTPIRRRHRPTAPGYRGTSHLLTGSLPSRRERTGASGSARCHGASYGCTIGGLSSVAPDRDPSTKGDLDAASKEQYLALVAARRRAPATRISRRRRGPVSPILRDVFFAVSDDRTAVARPNVAAVARIQPSAARPLR